MLKTDYKDDILNTTVNVNRKFNIVRSNGTLVEQNVELRETTVFEQEGDSFGAKDINETNEAINETNEEVDDVRGQICTNLLNPTAQTQTVNGVTFTNNGDGTYTVNGTASSTAYYPLADAFTDLNLSSKYKIVGCPRGGSENTYTLYDGQNLTNKDFGNGFVYTPTKQPKLYIRISNGYTANNLIFKPMLTTDLSATYDDFVPYTGDSGRLNEDVSELLDSVKGISEISAITNSDIDTILNS